MNDELPLAFEEMRRPALKPNTIYHLGVSGGKDSVGTLVWLVNESGIPRENIVATFCDIGNDHEWTLEHVALISRTVHPIETIKPEMGFFELAMQKRRFPGVKTRFCTEHLKIYPSQDYIRRLRLKGYDPIAVSGVRSEESADRARLPEWDYSGTLLCRSWRPLIRWTLAEVLALHRKYKVPLNPLYEIGAQRVGCWPCIMSRKEEIRTIALRFPARIDQIRQAEQGFQKAFGRYSSFFPSETVPPRFRSMAYRTKDGRDEMVATIDDVVRWSMTGKRARGSYLDEPDAQRGCTAGFCE